MRPTSPSVCRIVLADDLGRAVDDVDHRQKELVLLVLERDHPDGAIHVAVDVSDRGKRVAVFVLERGNFDDLRGAAHRRPSLFACISCMPHMMSNAISLAA
jgi:hypothetical protein